MNELKKAIIKSNKEIVKNIKPIDNEEKEILESYKNEKVDDIEFDNNLLKQAKTKQKKLKNDILTIRVNGEVKNNIKNIALENGLSYQSYVNMILYQISTRKINIKVNYTE